MTGCYAQRVSLTRVLFPKHNKGISDYEMTIADVLKARGYATACVGKWHLGHLKPFLPTQHGFDSYYGIPYSNDMPTVANGVNGVPLMRDNEIIEKPVIQDTLTQRYTEEAIGFIEKNKDQPFFLYLPHTMPHLPLHVSERFLGQSDRGLYGDIIEEIDWSTGQILGTLQKLGIDENTLVIYSSDNGPWTVKGLHGGCALPLRGSKGTAWEGGFRVPGIMRWPGRIPAGTVCGEMAATIDMLPTLAGLAGAKVPDDRIIDGKDIWPLMSGRPGAKTPREAYFYYRGYNLCAVRSGKWKLMLPVKGEKKLIEGRDSPQAVAVELYDLRADIAEAHNVAGEHPDVVERLMGMIEQCREDLGDAATGVEGKNVRDCGWVGEPV
jgi:arylsulfatase A-like enzyme